MKKKMKKLFASLLALALVLTACPVAEVQAAEDGYFMYLGYGGNNDWSMQYNSPDNADNNAEIKATTATVKPGDTVTIGLEFPTATDYTWWMAPVLVGEGITNVDYTINSILVDGKDVLADVDLAAGDAWWYEGTGDYSAEQAVRLAGGYNEWGTKYMAAGPAGCTKIEYNITVNDIAASAGGAAAAVPAGADEEFPMFVAYGGDAAASNDWGYAYAGEEGENAAGIVATNATAKVGDTVTIGLTFPSATVYTWYMAPVIVAEGVTNVGYTIDSITVDGTDVLSTVDLAAGDAFWYEGTGNYTNEQSIRLAGGYNEWGTKYMAEAPAGFTEIMYTITLTEVMYGGAAATLSTESYPAFIAIGADKEAGDWAYSYAGEETPVEGITAVTGELKNGETTTLSLTFDTPVAYTWYVAPCFVPEAAAAISPESTFDVKVFIDGAEVTPDFAAGDAFWAEGTGNFTEAVRIAGGYNEWGTQYIASPAGFSEIKYEITPTIYVAAAEEEAPQAEFDPNGTYHAYIGVQTPTWIFRNSWDDATYGKESGCFDQMGIVDNELNEWVGLGGTFTDVEITGNGTYTVAVNGYDFSANYADAPILGADGLFNLLFVSTDLPVNDAVVISNVVLKMDGKEIVTQDAFLDGDSKEVQKVLLANIWNNEITALPYYAAPTQSIEISFDVNGFANDAAPAVPEATEAPAAPEATEAPAATQAPAVSEDVEEGGSATGIIIAVVAVAAVAAIGGGIFVAKKKKAN